MSDFVGAMTLRALALVKSFSKSQKKIAMKSYSDQDRSVWFYTPTDHGGLSFSDMSSTQHRLVLSLVSSGLSASGYNTVAAIMGLDNILDNVEGFKVNFKRERGRDPLLYYITIFGNPGSNQEWGWRLGGHHISLHYTIKGSSILSFTPSFFGADPADSPLLGPHLHRPLASLEDLGRELFSSLSGSSLQSALISPVPPVDLTSGNRSVLSEGDKPMDLIDLWRGGFEGDTAKFLMDLQKGAEELLSLEEKHIEVLKFSFKPKGVQSIHLEDSQKEILESLLKAYLDRLPDHLADAQLQNIRKDFDNLFFCWAGKKEKYQPHYYRIQGKQIFVEYDNTQRGANHIHTVWRDLENDFAGDVLKSHYSNSPHHKDG